MDRKQLKDLCRRLQGAGYTVDEVKNRFQVRRDGALLLVLPGSRGRVEPHAWRNALALVRVVTGIDGRPRPGKRKKTRA